MEFKKYKISEISKSLFYGSMPKNDDIAEDGKYPIFSGYRFVGFSNKKNIDEPTLIVIARGVGGTGDVKIAPANSFLTNLSIAIDIDETVVDRKFLYYFLNVQGLRYLDTGAAQSQITINNLKQHSMLLPNLSIQKEIADILSTYDDLIENNNRRIALLEKAAQELYKEWFVRFRFPGYETAEFENGIPKDWRVLPVKETFEIFDTERIPVSSMDRDRMQKIYPYYGAAELMDYVDDYLFDGVYLLLGEDGSVMTPKGKPVLQYVWGKFWVNNHAHVLQGKMPFSTEYLHLMFGQMDITGIVTGAAQPKISQGRLFKKKTIIPNLDLVRQFDEIIQPIYKIIRNLKESNQNLTKQRDLLLPRLMSGKLEV